MRLLPRRKMQRNDMPKLIVGLGNTGSRYVWSRHNLGFRVLDALSVRHKGSWKESAVLQGSLAKIAIEENECFLLRPTTFMNNSGLSVKNFFDRHTVSLEDILVVCDDLSLPFGKIRVRPSGSAGGHNGLKSIMGHLHSNQFARLRMGIWTQDIADMADYVLGHFTAVEKKALPDFIEDALDGITCWVAEGINVAMNKFNRKVK